MLRWIITSGAALAVLTALLTGRKSMVMVGAILALVVKILDAGRK